MRRRSLWLDAAFSASTPDNTIMQNSTCRTERHITAKMVLRAVCVIDLVPFCELSHINPLNQARSVILSVIVHYQGQDCTLQLVLAPFDKTIDSHGPSAQGTTSVCDSQPLCASSNVIVGRTPITARTTELLAWDLSNPVRATLSRLGLNDTGQQ